MKQLKSRPKGTVKQKLPKTIRVAIYTRKSVTDGLDQEFTTLDAQRESVEAYIVSQRSLGWKAIDTRYDDGGFSGANTDRPAFQRLLEDVAAGKVDVIAVYRMDRLSRSLLDFARLLELFQVSNVAFASVTEHFDTSTPAGRMVLNLLATFAQYERESIAQRTKDKMLASRKRGMWTGGRPILGYDVVEKKLVINESEAERVRHIFDLYLKLGSLLEAAKELKKRGWKNKTWTNKAGDLVQGGVLNKVILSYLLKNPLYVGKVRADGELFGGVHKAIITQEVFDAVAKSLATNTGNRDAAARRSKPGSALLAGLVRCGPCGSAMSQHHAKKGERRYTYYVCTKHQKEGAAACPASRVAAGELERFVLEQIREIGRDPLLLEATVKADKHDREAKRPALETEARTLSKKVTATERKRDKLVETMASGDRKQPGLLKGIETLDAELEELNSRLDTARQQLAELDSAAIDPDQLRETLDQLDPVWDELFPLEKARLLDLLIERIEFDGGQGVVEITFHPGGPEALQGDE